MFFLIFPYLLAGAVLAMLEIQYRRGYKTTWCAVVKPKWSMVSMVYGIYGLYVVVFNITLQYIKCEMLLSATVFP